MSQTAERRTRQALIGLGANLGDRAATLDGATARLRAWPGIAALARSSLYETDPVGMTDQPQFLNAVIGVETRLAPQELLAALQTIEQEFGRVREVRWGPRTLDLDLLAYEGETCADPVLTLPHPRMMERAFVRVPLQELLETEPFLAPWTFLRQELTATAAQVAAHGVHRYKLT